MKPPNSTKTKSNPLTPRTVRAINNYVKSLHTRENYEFNKHK